MKQFLEEHYEEYLELIKELTAIPAPSHKEERRAAFVETYLKEHGWKQAYQDQVSNVIVEMNPEGCEDLHLYTAHLDTVFPDLTPIPVVETEDRIAGPGVGDDTANAAALLMILRWIQKQGKHPKQGLLFVFNVCEEGLGNLLGTKTIMEQYGNRIRKHIAFDGSYDWICNRAVGSKRYRLTVETRGGHSYGDFGTPNAIAKAAKLIEGLYQIDSSDLPDKTTYNVGLIEGGTSVNTIAQKASFLYEYRSDQNDSLQEMKHRAEQVMKERLSLLDIRLEDGMDVKNEECRLTIELIGDRPGMGPVDMSTQQDLSSHTEELVRSITGHSPQFESGSTDCNIPLSMGIPAICYGAYLGEGQHTRQEFIYKDSLRKGLELAFATVQEEF